MRHANHPYSPSLRAEMLRFVDWQPWSADADALPQSQLLSGIPSPLPPSRRLAGRLSCYENARLLAVGDGPRDRFYLSCDAPTAPAVPLSGSIAPIFKFNQRCGIRLTTANVTDYARFLFAFTWQNPDGVYLAEHPSDLPWSSDVSRTEREGVAQELIPLTYLASNRYELHYLTGSVRIRKALFRADILIAAREVSDLDIDLGPRKMLRPGERRIVNLILLKKDLPVITNVVSHEPTYPCEVGDAHS